MNEREASQHATAKAPLVRRTGQRLPRTDHDQAPRPSHDPQGDKAARKPVTRLEDLIWEAA